ALAGAFASALPSAPAGLGVFEAATVSAYTLLGTDQSTALVIALILHAIQFVAQCLLGMIGLYLLGENLGNLFRKASLQKTQK
ncbi:MAG: lysylphosphatidylglycerol synthase domain-containing protein, partial [Anaerolineaceae bacterium]